jgi:hypothetical protein
MQWRQRGAGLQGGFGHLIGVHGEFLEVFQDEQLPPRARCTRGNERDPGGLRKTNDERSTCRPRSGRTSGGVSALGPLQVGT